MPPLIIIKCIEEKNIYSTFHLVKAFFPDEEVTSKVDADISSDIEISADGCIMVSLRKTEETADKKALEKALYDELVSYTGRTLPWGVLTGVRPSKLALSAVRNLGEDADPSTLMDAEARFKKDMDSQYRVSPEKSTLIWKIASREEELISRALYSGNRDAISKDTFSLYIGIPVCPSICSYCSFSSGPFSVWSDRLDDYINALCSELRAVADMTAGMGLTSVYIGGGTPTVLNERQLEELLGCISACFSAPGFTLPEFTLEAGRPDTITAEKLTIAKSYGVNRISINPQTMQQQTLERIGRDHTVADVIEKFHLARGMGFSNINMDLIAGLPGEGLAEMTDTLRQIAELGPESLTVHSLAVKRAARLKHQYASAEEAYRMLKQAEQAAGEMGLAPYYMYRQKSMAGNLENTGYARKGYECIYNIMIIEEEQSIIACGAGASSKIRLKSPVPNPDRNGKVMTSLLHQDNPKDINQYISSLSSCIAEKNSRLKTAGNLF